MTPVTPKPKNLIEKERAKTKVDVGKLHNFLENDAATAAAVDRIIDEITNDPVLSVSPAYYDYTKTETREITARKIARLISYKEIDSKEEFLARMSLIGMMDPQLCTRLGVHLMLFGKCIEGNGTDAQIKFWLHDKGALLCKNIYGCFGMTEVAHGSNVANLQTTATFNPERQSFTINTPNLGATKWWIGGAAHSANFCTVYARLISKGKDYGVKTFVVQLRDKNFDLMPGVVIGDIGAKMGRDGIDNGWIQFNNVEIPKEFFLQRYAKIDSEGNVEVPPLEQVSYSALLGGRVSMVMDSFRIGSKFTTIALRYAVGRQQFGNPRDEHQLINYSLHQYRLLPYLALTYCLSPVSYHIVGEFERILKELHDGDNLMRSLKQLKDLFVHSASLKSTSTWLAAQLIDECRQACGGHGYSSYNGFGKGYNDWVVQCTWEGDNNVLALNAAKSMLKMYSGNKAKISKTVGFEYFAMDPDSKVELSSLRSYTDIWGLILVKLFRHCGEIVKKESWEAVSKESVLISKMHANYYMFNEFLKKIESDKELDDVSREYLIKLYKLCSIYFIDKFSGEFQQLGALNGKEITALQLQLKQLLLDVRDQVIGLTDAFKLPDSILNASIGHYDGDLYTNYFRDVTTQNGKGDKPPYLDVLTKMLTRTEEIERRGGFTSEESLEKLRK